jgi:hypothetical protein
MVALVGVRSGRALAATLTRNGGSTHSHGAPPLLPGPPSDEERPLPAAATLPPPYTGGAKVPTWMMVLYLVAPLLLLLPLAVIDMGLLLVMVIPIGVASVLALGLHRLTRAWQAASALFAFALVFVLFT